MRVESDDLDVKKRSHAYEDSASIILLQFQRRVTPGCVFGQLFPHLWPVRTLE
jgi:hypothetical protein